MLLHNAKDPRPQRGDVIISDQVEMIGANAIKLEDHQDDVNTFLVSLRDDPLHTAYIRSVDFQLTTLKSNNSKVTGVTTITYRLIGTTDAPYIT